MGKERGKSQESEIKIEKKKKDTGKRGLDACHRKAKEERFVIWHSLSFRLMKEDTNLQSTGERSNKTFYLSKSTNSSL